MTKLAVTAAVGAAAFALFRWSGSGDRDEADDQYRSVIPAQAGIYGHDRWKQTYDAVFMDPGSSPG